MKDVPATDSLAGSKEKILRRIREGLEHTAPKRHLGHSHSAAPTESSSGGGSSEQWLPSVPEDLKGRIALFRGISEELKTSFHLCKDPSEAINILQKIAAEEDWKEVAGHRHPLVDLLLEGLSPTVKVWTSDGGYSVSRLEQADAGITGCEALVAQTGSILVSPPTSGGRVLSVLPPHHIVVASVDQVVRDLRDAFLLLRKRHPQGLPRYFSFITGPSRTGDIERILVLGAHGPRKLTVLLLDDAN